MDAALPDPESPPAGADYPAVPPGPPAPRWHPLVRSFLFLIAFLVTQVGGAFLVHLGLWAAGLSAVSERLEARAEFLLLDFALSGLLLFPFTVLFLRFLDRKSFADLGFRWPVGGKPRAWRQAVIVPLATLGVLALWMAVLAAAGLLHVRGFSSEWQQGIPDWPIPPALDLFLLQLGFLIQGGVEEWLFRGYIFRALRERWGFAVAGLVSAAVFAALHAGNPEAAGLGLFNTFVAGVLLAALVERSGSLWSATLTHGVWNFAVGSLASLPISGIAIFKLLDVGMEGPHWLTGGGYGPEASAVLTAIALPLIAFLWPRRRQVSTPVAAHLEVEEVRPGVVAGDVQGEVTGVDPREIQIGQQ